MVLEIPTYGGLGGRRERVGDRQGMVEAELCPVYVDEYHDKGLVVPFAEDAYRMYLTPNTEL